MKAFFKILPKSILFALLFSSISSWSQDLNPFFKYPLETSFSEINSKTPLKKTTKKEGFIGVCKTPIPNSINGMGTTIYSFNKAGKLVSSSFIFIGSKIDCMIASVTCATSIIPFLKENQFDTTKTNYGNLISYKQFPEYADVHIKFKEVADKTKNSVIIIRFSEPTYSPTYIKSKTEAFFSLINAKKVDYDYFKSIRRSLKIVDMLDFEAIENDECEISKNHYLLQDYSSGDTIIVSIESDYRLFINGLDLGFENGLRFDPDKEEIYFMSRQLGIINKTKRAIYKTKYKKLCRGAKTELLLGGKTLTPCNLQDYLKEELTIDALLEKYITEGTDADKLLEKYINEFADAEKLFSNKTTNSPVNNRSTYNVADKKQSSEKLKVSEQTSTAAKQKYTGFIVLNNINGKNENLPVSFNINELSVKIHVEGFDPIDGKLNNGSFTSQTTFSNGSKIDIKGKIGSANLTGSCTIVNKNGSKLIVGKGSFNCKMVNN